MGQKVHPHGIRLGIIREHSARWFAPPNKKYERLFENDIKIRRFLHKELALAQISEIRIERPAKNAIISVKSARPGQVIGKKGEDIEPLRQKLMKIVGDPVQITIEEVRKPDLDSCLVAQTIAQQLEKRIMFRRAMKRAVANTMRAGALGIKIAVSGRLGGAEIARTEWVREGRVPLHTFRADIDYGVFEAKTTYGIIGVKVWIFKGEIFDKSQPAEETAEKS